MVSAAALLTLSLVGLWVWPPPWMRWAWGAALLAAALTAAWRRRTAPLQPARGEWPRFAALCVLGGLSTMLIGPALEGRVPPEGPLPDLAPPLVPGQWIVAHGGATETVNRHLGVLFLPEPRRSNWREQAHAVDVLGLAGLWPGVALGRPTDPAAYPIWDAAVLAPCAGEVVAVVDGLPDQRVPEMDSDRRAGNHVLLACGAHHVLLAHLRKGSVVVFVGQEVETGAPLGRVGNSGASSEPHLHLHVQTPATAGGPFSGRPVPFTVAGRHLVRNAVLLP